MLEIRIIILRCYALLDNRNDGIMEMDSLEEDEPIPSETEETTTETETSEAPLSEEKAVDSDNNTKKEIKTKEEEESGLFMFFPKTAAPTNIVTSWKDRGNASVPAEGEPPLKKQKQTSSKTSR